MLWFTFREFPGRNFNAYQSNRAVLFIRSTCKIPLYAGMFGFIDPINFELTLEIDFTLISTFLLKQSSKFSAFLH
jgi:hypothetical protein